MPQMGHILPCSKTPYTADFQLYRTIRTYKSHLQLPDAVKKELECKKRETTQVVNYAGCELRR